jgi:hypothetical protein
MGTWKERCYGFLEEEEEFWGSPVLEPLVSIESSKELPPGLTVSTVALVMPYINEESNFGAFYERRIIVCRSTTFKSVVIFKFLPQKGNKYVHRLSTSY